MPKRIATLAAVVLLAASATAAAHGIRATLTMGQAYAVPLSLPQVTTLVTPRGVPVGGRWQRWADEMGVPTFAGPLSFVTPKQLCGVGASACSLGPPWYGSQYAIAVHDRYSLADELGHVFDWRYLTDETRRKFAALWHSSAPWQDSAAGLQRGIEDGLEGAFQIAYEACALNEQVGVPFSWGAGTPVIAFKPSTCKLITAIGVADGATMPVRRVRLSKRHANSRW